MKKLKTIVLWALSIMLIFLGVIFISDSIASALFFILSGAICNPLLLKNIEIKKKLSIPLFFIFFILGFSFVPTNNNEISASTPSETETSTMLVESESSSISVESKESLIESVSESETIVEPDVPGSLEVHFLDVGQGLSVLIKSDGHYMLYDGGDSDKSSFVVSYLKDQGVQNLDYIIASHYDSDHLNGVIGALHAFNVDTVIGPDYIHDSKLYQSFIDTVGEKGKNVEHPAVGSEYFIGNSKFIILSPNYITSDSNNNSVSIKIVNGSNSFILTGDAESSSESSMCNSGIDIDCDILCIGHHGSASSTSWEFLQYTVPEYAVISCGSGNQYGHPDKDTMDKLQSMEISVFRTDKQGTIIATSDGSNISWNTAPCNDYSPGDDNDFGTVSQVESEAEPSPEQPEVSQEVYDDMVWIPATGEKYHSIPNCGRMNPNKARQISRSDAISRGYDACQKCW